MSLLVRLVHGSVHHLIRLACGLTLFALATMVYSIVVPTPLPIMLAMSVGHLLGVAAFGCFFLAVVIDAARARGRGASVPPSGRRGSEGPPSSR
jgi:hypothetical protein